MEVAVKEARVKTTNPKTTCTPTLGHWVVSILEIRGFLGVIIVLKEQYTGFLITGYVARCSSNIEKEISMEVATELAPYIDVVDTITVPCAGLNIAVLQRNLPPSVTIQPALRHPDTQLVEIEKMLNKGADSILMRRVRLELGIRDQIQQRFNRKQLENGMLEIDCKTHFNELLESVRAKKTEKTIRAERSKK